MDWIVRSDSSNVSLVRSFLLNAAGNPSQGRVQVRLNFVTIQVC